MLGYHTPPPGSRHPLERTHPPRADTPWEQTPPPPRSRHPLPEQTPPWEQTPPKADPPGADTPPGPEPPPEADSGIRSTSGRYASYWNAFLFMIDFIIVILKTFKNLFLWVFFEELFKYSQVTAFHAHCDGHSRDPPPSEKSWIHHELELRLTGTNILVSFHSRAIQKIRIIITTSSGNCPQRLFTLIFVREKRHYPVDLPLKSLLFRKDISL